MRTRSQAAHSEDEEEQTSSDGSLLPGMEHAEVQAARTEALERALHGVERGETEDEEESDEEDDDEDDDDEDDEDENEDVEDDDEEEQEGPRSFLGWLLGGRLGARAPAEPIAQPRFKRLSEVVAQPMPLSLEQPLAYHLNFATSGVNKRLRCDAPGLDSGTDPSTKALVHNGPFFPGPSAPQGSAQAEAAGTSKDAGAAGGASKQAGRSSQAGEPAGPVSTTPPERRSSLLGSLLSASPPALSTRSRRAQEQQQQAGAEGEEGASSRRSRDSSSGAKSKAKGASKGKGKHEHEEEEEEEQPRPSGLVLPSRARLLAKRDCGLGDVPGFSRSERAHLHCRALPTRPGRTVDDMDSRAYIGQFSRGDGAFFVTAYQDQRVRVYDVGRDWALRKDVRARGIRWTITDTCLSPDQRLLLYGTISPTVHAVTLGSSWDGVVESVANVTEVHDALDLDPQRSDSFGVWSIRWSGDGKEIVAGTNVEAALVYDVGACAAVAWLRGHDDDVNAVEYLDDTPNLIATGSDDTLIKLWDRRTVDASAAPARQGERRRPSRNSKPVGVLLGHTEGITHMNAKGDGRYLLSNAKDQTAKLWDVRAALRTEEQVSELRRGPQRVPRFNWDYRWMAYPGQGLDVRHPHDKSLMTYRGHTVRQTLIRAYFSPAHTTGQRLIYSGSADGCVYVWDAVTGHVQGVLRHHNALVRDCSWHPHKPMITTVSWDGTVVTWHPGALDDDGEGPLRRRSTRSDRMPDW
uniref:Uncharacterized protein n=1 Tax=Chlamydomonas leiostraca TaxID=1034604 RepID=A0A7S0WVH0_9CHLO|mmetsp:Transcript_2964/g.7264  ORF Transcript_2964/g.7264 Transcript_2964/m.7264 type:complete len:747 (+) Transcript_2964:191-2431(+)